MRLRQLKRLKKAEEVKVGYLDIDTSAQKNGLSVYMVCGTCIRCVFDMQHSLCIIIMFVYLVHACLLVRVT